MVYDMLDKVLDQIKEITIRFQSIWVINCQMTLF